ncbi:PREDICTED: uncharacterized protein LOC105557467 [Vollenhovia emeryi]|uniref:uncharacterized protein LOC105557467 n=1 Tax=Vollenhovia emeryi TaxID=411798 RepID=UPI0005F46EE7|nr:PREDICTED: uncharacterized protein LOC105557467 [Vollenhovia emeryi]
MADVDNTQRSTKRAILSCIARIFDPLGLLGPVIVRVKLFMQRLWILQVDWDESLPSDLYTEWIAYRSQLKRLNELRIARMVSRVAPMKSISLPRLELCGAQLLSQLIDKVLPILDLKVHETYYWTDATIVLDWIRSPSRVFNTFVVNRIGEIQELTQIESWHHVSTNENPADILSRGTDPEAFIGVTLWWNGPSWINKDKSLWPGSAPPDVNPEEFLEHRKVTISTVTIQECDLIEGFSSYIKLVRTIARCLRFIYNVRSEPSKRRSGLIAALELEEARKVIVRRIQQAAFHKEIEAIKNQADVPRGTRLLGLNPFLDQEDLLRVGGRLRHSALPYETKHQLILPSHNRFTQLVIEHEHARLLHAGPQATLGALRLQYWILGARGIIRAIVHKCVPCFKAGPRASQQVMGNLPSFRVKPSRPFDNLGVDYCGPIFVREGNRRNARRSKAWIAIFVCLVTKAVHIELVTNLSTEGLLNALKRFIGRRGKPSNMFSDNGTNFVGANCELEELFNREEFRHSIVNKMAEEAIAWHFIPPKAPYFGRLWEAAVRSAKLHLNRVTSKGALTSEETATLLTQGVFQLGHTKLHCVTPCKILVGTLKV